AEGARQFVISDGREKIYLVEQKTQSPAQLQATAEALTGADAIGSPVVVVGQVALAATKRGKLLRFTLPSLAAAGETQLPAPVAWGPHAAGDRVLLATAAGQLPMLQADGSVAWTQTSEHGEPIGAPAVVGSDVLVAYRKGVLERRSAADGKVLGKQIDLAQSLDSGPVPF